MDELIIKNGFVYDPLNNINGEQLDIFIKNGKIVSEVGADATVIDAKNKIIMPGGIDGHSHIAGAKVSMGRLLRPEDIRRGVRAKTKITRSESGVSVPTTFSIGYRYARMGYTTVFEPAMPPLKARHTHEELADTPIVDKGAFPLLGSNWMVFHYLKQQEIEKCAAFVAWMLNATKGFAIKLVNPAGLESWNWGGNIRDIDTPVEFWDVTPREVITGLAKVNELLGLPHSIHVHFNNIGRPGNFKTTIESFDACRENKNPGVERNQVIHGTHIQFNGYGGDSWKSFASGGLEIADWVNKNDHVTLDVGQVVFSNTTTMTADGPLEYYLHTLNHLKWTNGDVEIETSSGVVPLIYKRKNPVSAIQWTIGLELLLGIEDPWKVMLSTDHPNGGPFTRYPEIIAWLMSQEYRNDTLKSAHKRAGKRSGLATLDREYSLFEIAIVTRATQAKALGINYMKGHLGVGADADVAIYDLDKESKDPKEIMKAFSNTLYTIKGGEVVAKNGEIVSTPMGRTLYLNVKVDPSLENTMLKEFSDIFRRNYSVNMANYPVQPIPSYLPLPKEIKLDATHVA